MKRLYLLRHAKSSWDDDGVRDHERQLAPRGVRAATLMGVYLSQQGYLPDLVLCSSARRAVETLERLRPRLEPAPEVNVEHELYGADTSELLDRVAAVADGIGALLIVGHNPTIGMAAIALAGRGDGVARQRLRQNYPTGALAAFELESWREAAPGSGRLIDFTTPRDLV
jgi:phosphohistidine phosphatase